MVLLHIESDGEIPEEIVNRLADVFKECLIQKKVMNDEQHGRMESGRSDTLYRE